MSAIENAHQTPPPPPTTSTSSESSEEKPIEEPKQEEDQNDQQQEEPSSTTVDSQPSEPYIDMELDPTDSSVLDKENDSSFAYLLSENIMMDDEAWAITHNRTYSFDSNNEFYEAPDRNHCPDTSFIYSVLANPINDDEFYSKLVKHLGGEYVTSEEKPFVNFVKSIIHNLPKDPLWTNIILNLTHSLNSLQFTFEEVCDNITITALCHEVIVAIESPNTRRFGFQLLSNIHSSLPFDLTHSQLLPALKRLLISVLNSSSIQVVDLVDISFFLAKTTRVIGFCHMVHDVFDLFKIFFNKLSSINDLNILMGASYALLCGLLSFEMLPTLNLFSNEGDQDCCCNEGINKDQQQQQQSSASAIHCDPLKTAAFYIREHFPLVRETFEIVYECLVYYRFFTTAIDKHVLNCLVSTRDRFQFQGKNLVHSLYINFKEFVENNRTVSYYLSKAEQTDDVSKLKKGFEKHSWMLEFMLKLTKFMFVFTKYETELLHGCKTKFTNNPSCNISDIISDQDEENEFTPYLIKSSFLTEHDIQKRTNVNKDESNESIYKFISELPDYLTRIPSWLDRDMKSSSDQDEKSYEESAVTFRLTEVFHTSTYSDISKQLIINCISNVCELYDPFGCNSNDIESRKNQFISADFQDNLSDILVLTVVDQNAEIIIQMISVFSKLLSRFRQPQCYYKFWILLLKNSELHVIEYVLRNLTSSFSSLFPHDQVPDKDLMEDFLNAIMVCEENLSRRVIWRLYTKLIEELRRVSTLVPVELIKKCILPKLMVRMTTMSQLPCRHALIRCLLLIYIERFARSDLQILKENVYANLGTLDLFKFLDLRIFRGENTNFNMRRTYVHTYMILMLLHAECNPKSALTQYFIDSNRQNFNIQITDLVEEFPFLHMLNPLAPPVFDSTQESALFIAFIISRHNLLNKVCLLGLQDRVPSIRAGALTLLNALLFVMRHCDSNPVVQNSLVSFVQSATPKFAPRIAEETDQLVLEQLHRVHTTLQILNEQFYGTSEVVLVVNDLIDQVCAQFPDGITQDVPQTKCDVSDQVLTQLDNLVSPLPPPTQRGAAQKVHQDTPYRSERTNVKSMENKYKNSGPMSWANLFTNGSEDGE